MKTVLDFKSYTVFLIATFIIPKEEAMNKTNGQGHVLKNLSTGTGFGQRAIALLVPAQKHDTGYN